MAKSEKMEKAVARARGQSGATELLTKGAEERALAQLQGDMQGELQTFDPAMIAELIASGDMEAAEQIIELQQGMMVTGMLLGNGPIATLEKPGTKTGETHQVQTWRMDLDSGARVTFLSSAQLDRMLPPFIGRRTVVARGGTRKTKKGMNLTEYFVAAWKDGKAESTEQRTV